MRDGLLQAAGVEGAVDRFTLGSQQAQGDLRSGTVMCDAQELTAVIGDLDSFARRG
jgi:hypothetical protein